MSPLDRGHQVVPFYEKSGWTKWLASCGKCLWCLPLLQLILSFLSKACVLACPSLGYPPKDLSLLPAFVFACPSLGDPSKKFRMTHLTFAWEMLHSSECHVPTREEWRWCEKRAHVAEEENGTDIR
jgi:hypothetical protein